MKLPICLSFINALLTVVELVVVIVVVVVGTVIVVSIVAVVVVVFCHDYVFHIKSLVAYSPSLPLLCSLLLLSFYQTKLCCAHVGCLGQSHWRQSPSQHSSWHRDYQGF